MKVLLFVSLFLLGFVDSTSKNMRQSCSKHTTDLLLANMKTEFAVLRQMIDSLNRKQDCPTGFNALPGYDNSCYMLITSHHGWNGAGDYCRRLARGAHLVAMETAEEDQAIISHLNSLLRDGYLTGLCNSSGAHFGVLTSGQRRNHTDHSVSFYWKPFQSNNLHIHYENFHLGEPSSAAGGKIDSIQQNCLQYSFMGGSAHNSFKWDDVQCESSPRCFLCEFER